MINREEDIRPEKLRAELAVYLERDRALWFSGRDSWVDAPCPACAEPLSASRRFLVREYPCAECGACGTVYQSPRPDESGLAAYYAQAESYTFWAEKMFPATAAKRRETIAVPLAAKVAAALVNQQPRSDGCVETRLVEIGAGSGLVLEEVRRFGICDDLIAVEPTPALAAVLRQKGFKVLESGWAAIELSGRPADVVCAFEVIEHLFSPRDFLRAVRGMLSPGGLLVLSCPNIRGFDFQILGYEMAGNFGLAHINMFHPESLRRLLTETGFVVQELSTPGRLDADLVRQKILSGDLDVSGRPFLQRVLVDEWETAGADFQAFLQDQGMSSNMLVIASRA